jgi:hypothetical protein
MIKLIKISFNIKKIINFVIYYLMYVKIDSDIVENILKAHTKRNRDQIRVYGLLIGTMEGKDVYHVKNCIFGYIYESKSVEQDGDEQISKMSVRIYTFVKLYLFLAEET